MTATNQGMTTKDKAIFVLVALALGAAIGLFIFRDPLAAKKTDEIVKETVEETKQFEEAVKEHAVETVTRTVIIREQIANQVGALDADGLANAMVHEIMLWRGTSADYPQARPSGIRN
jgi:hypothetical protein